MLAQDGVVAVGAGRNHMNGHARDLLNALQVELGIGGQLVKVGDADGAVAPAC